MQVFKAYFKVIQKNLAQISIYFAVFLVIALLFTFTSTNNHVDQFIEMQSDIAVINRDENSPLIQGLTEYLGEKGTLHELEDSTESIQDALFFRRVKYVAIIPKGFSRQFWAGETPKLEAAAAPDSTDSYYINLLADKYWSTAARYRDYGTSMTQEEIVQAVKRDLETDTQVEFLGTAEPVDQNYGFFAYYQYLAYILIAVMVLAMSSIMMVFNRPELRRRNLCAPIPLRSVNAQMVLGSVVFSLGCWLVMVLLSVALYGAKLTDYRLLFISALNALAYTMVGVSIGFMVGIFIKGFNAQSAISNVLSLGMSFLSGVFVPQEMMGDAVLTVASFTPTYWYVRANNSIKTLTKFNWENLSSIYVNMLVQLGFAAAILAVALMISKQKQAGNN